MKSSVQSTKRSDIAGRGVSPELDSTYFLGITSNIDPVTQQYYSNVVKNGGRIRPDSLLIVDDFVKELRAAGLLGRIIDMGIFCGENLAAATTKLIYTKETTPYLTNKDYPESSFSESRGLSASIERVMDTNCKIKHTKFCNLSISYYSFENTPSPSNVYYAGIGSTGYPARTVLFPACFDGNFYFDAYSASNSRAYRSNTPGDSLYGYGLLFGNHPSSTITKLYQNGYVQATGGGSSSLSDYNAVANANIYAPYALNGRFGFYHIGDSMSDEEVFLFSGIVTAFQSRLGRMSSSRKIEDEVAIYKRNILNNGGKISNASLDAVNQFVKDLKFFGIWNKIVDMGVFCGDNLPAALTKLKYRNESGPYLINYNFNEADYFERGPSGGLRGNGVDKYLDTNFKLGNLPSTNCSMGVYNRNTVSGATYGPMGGTDGTNHFILYYPAGGNNYYYVCFNWSSGDGNGYIVVNYTPGGLIFGTTLDMNSVLYRNGSAIDSKSYTSGTMPNVNGLVFSNNRTTMSASLDSLYFYGYNITAAEASMFHRAVWYFQWRLNRV